MWILCLLFVFVTGQCFGCMVGTVLRAAVRPPVVDGRFTTSSFRFGMIIMALISAAWSWHHFAADTQMQVVTIVVLGIGTVIGILIGYQSSGG